MTPETDAKASDIIGFFSCATVPADFARKLERERDEWYYKAHAAREHLAAIKHYLTKERDDALAQIVQAECRAERFCQERDEAREKAERYRLEANAMMLQRDEARSLVDHYREQKDLLPISWDV